MDYFLEFQSSAVISFNMGYYYIMLGEENYDCITLGKIQVSRINHGDLYSPWYVTGENWYDVPVHGTNLFVNGRPGDNHQ